MKKNKLLTIMLIILVSITLLGVVALVVFTQVNKDTEAAEPDIDTVVESSVDIEEITTNIAGNNYVKMSLKVQTDSKEAAEELMKRDFQVKNIIIEELSEMKATELDGKKGKEMLVNTLKMRINELMQEGKVQKVYIPSYIIQ